MRFPSKGFPKCEAQGCGASAAKHYQEALLGVEPQGGRGLGPGDARGRKGRREKGA